jgi:uncharacterized protein (TIGR02594 family)
MDQPNSSGIVRYVVNARALRLRESPALDSRTVATVPRGTVVQVITVPVSGSVWAQVQAGKRIGWMARKYLTPEDHQAAPPSAQEEFPWMPIALGELGVRERTEPGESNPRVEEYLLSTDLGAGLAKDDSTPWCSGFVNWCVEKSGYAGSNSAAAASWLGWGRGLNVARRGVVAVLKRAGGHHVGFYLRRDTEKLWLLGGNQTNEVGIAGYDPARLLGYRVPAR